MLASRLGGYAGALVLFAAGCGTGSGMATSASTSGEAGGSGGSGTSTSTTGTGGAKACAVFLPTSPWNTDISAAPTTTLYTLPSAKLFPNFLLGPLDGIPYQYVNKSVAKVNVTFSPDAIAQSDPGPYPLPPGALVEGSGGAHVLLVDTDECVLYELYAATEQDSGWSAYSGAIWDLKINSTRPFCWTSADSAGLPVFPGLLRYEEVATGAIDHALRFTLKTVQRAFVAPANHLTDGSTNPSDPPYGLRVRLKASVDISAAPPQAKVILTAMKKYGMILADTGYDWTLSGAPDPSWDVDYLENFAGSDFEVVEPGPLTTTSTTPSCSP